MDNKVINKDDIKMGDVLLEAVHISKSFGGVKALVDANIQLRAGEVHALVGGNGSGKTTLVNIFCGIFQQEGGEILVYGKPHHFKSPIDARKAGVGSVMQNLYLVEKFDAVHNLYLGQEIKKAGFLMNRKAMREGARKEFDRLGISMPDLRSWVVNFSGGQRQSIAFAKALLGDTRILLLDEPTAALGVKETANVMELIRSCRDKGVAILIISHSMEDVFEISDRITIIRHGNTVACKPMNEINRDTVVDLITGKLERLD